jgi:hypothetical protein
MDTEPDCTKLHCSKLGSTKPNQDLPRQITMCRQLREQSMTKVNRHILLFGLCPSSEFLKKPALFLSLGKEACNLLDALN